MTIKWSEIKSWKRQQIVDDMNEFTFSAFYPNQENDTPLDVVKETEKAYQLKWEGDYNGRCYERTFWIPKSVVC